MTRLAAILFLALPVIFNPSERERVFIDDSAKEIILPINELPILIDSTGRLTFRDILERQYKFSVDPGFKPKDYCIACNYWVKVPLLIGRDTKKEWMLEFYDQTIDSITAYFPEINGDYYTENVGDFLPFNNKPFAHKNFGWIIDTNLKGQQNIYFKVKSHSYADIRVAIRTVNTFIYYSLNEYFLFGIFYGMIFIITLYNLLIYFAIRETKYLYYTFYILSVGVYAMCVDGIAYQYLWPNWPQWNQVAYGAALYSLIFWALLFSKKFLNTAETAPLLDKLIIGAAVIRSLIFIYAMFFDQGWFEYRNLEILPLTLVFYTSIYVLMKGYKPARFFVLAYGILFIGFLIKALIALSLIPFTILTYYTLNLCFLLEMLFLTFALSDRVRILKANKDLALLEIIQQQEENVSLKNKVNKELEEKIRERTQELLEKSQSLEETNKKLLEKTEEVDRMNVLLDKDNWKLKNNVREVLKDRLFNKDLTLEQFNNIFPNQHTCLKYLHDHKWGDGYACYKCNNDKYSAGQTKFSRRCSRCGYDESVTCNTVFHHIRFPLTKAFYVLYATINQPGSFTLDELSNALDLRRDTVWKFRQKIKQLNTRTKGAVSVTFGPKIDIGAAN